MRRPLLVIPAVVFAITACVSSDEGGAATTQDVGNRTATTAPVETSVAPTETTADGQATSTTSAQTPQTTSGRPLAPDFTLDLGNGGSYTLSEGERPVYLVFWAEW